MIKSHIKNNTAWLEINRAKQRNALSIALLEELVLTLKKLEKNDSIRVIVLHGKDNFSAGGDINDMKIKNKQDAENIAQKVQDIYFKISEISKPIIAYTKGLVYGGGLELALVCDIIISHSKAQFSLPEARLGIIPGGGATQRLKTTIGKQNATYMLFTAEQFSAQWMLNHNLIQEIADNISHVEWISNRIAAQNPIAIMTLKQLLQKDRDFEAESESFAKLLLGDGQKGINSFIEKNQFPKW